MTQLWLNADGDVLLDGDGALFLCDYCPCDVVTGSGTTGPPPPTGTGTGTGSGLIEGSNPCNCIALPYAFKATFVHGGVTYDYFLHWYPGLGQWQSASYYGEEPYEYFLQLVCSMAFGGGTLFNVSIACPPSSGLIGGRVYAYLLPHTGDPGTPHDCLDPFTASITGGTDPCATSINDVNTVDIEPA